MICEVCRKKGIGDLPDNLVGVKCFTLCDRCARKIEREVERRAVRLRHGSRRYNRPYRIAEVEAEIRNDYWLGRLSAEKYREALREVEHMRRLEAN